MKRRAAGAALTAVLAASAVAVAAVHDRPTALSGGAAAPACRAAAPGDHRIPVAAGRVPVVLHVPPGPATARRALVLALPGAGQTASDFARYTGYSRLADADGFLVAYPTASGARPFWNVSGAVAGKPDDVAYLRQVIGTLTGPAACADPARVGATGVSNGGGMAARLACDAADLLSAAAPVAGGYSTLPDCRPRRPLALLEIHGLDDSVVPYGGTGPTGAGAVGPYLAGWRARDRCGARATRSEPAPDVVELRWTCADGRQVVHDRVLDAEHGWPGAASLRPFSSTARTWRFLSAFRNASAKGSTA